MRHRKKRFPSSARAVVAVAALLMAGCDLDNGKDSGLPTDPSVIPDVQNVAASVSIYPQDIPADGISTSTIEAKIVQDGQPVPNIPVLFYSEWGTLYTACAKPNNVVASQFGSGLPTSVFGTASTLLKSPVLPNIYAMESQSNVVNAFFLVDGLVLRASNWQNLYKLHANLKCQGSCTGRSVTLVASFATRSGQRVSGCTNAQWQVSGADPNNPEGFNNIRYSDSTLCSESGTTQNTFTFEQGVSPGTSYTVQVAATFSGASTNECILDVSDSSMTVVNSIKIKR